MIHVLEILYEIEDDKANGNIFQSALLSKLNNLMVKSMDKK